MEKHPLSHRIFFWFFGFVLVAHGLIGIINGDLMGRTKTGKQVHVTGEWVYFFGALYICAGILCFDALFGMRLINLLDKIGKTISKYFNKE